MSQQAYDQLDKRLVAHHEAAHAVVAAAGGLFGSPWIERRTDRVDAENERTWAGHFDFFDDMPASVAVAGIVGECLMDEPEVTADDVIDYW